MSAIEITLLHPNEVEVAFDGGWTGNETPRPPLGSIARYSKDLSGTSADGTIRVTRRGGGPSALLSLHSEYVVTRDGAVWTNHVNVTNSSQYGFELRRWNGDGGPLVVDALVVAYE